MIYYEYDRFGMTEDYIIEEYGNLHYPYLHFHRNFELVYLISGSLKVTVNYSDVVLNGNQFILVFPNQIHSFESLGDAHAKVCIFSPMLVNSFYHALNNCVPKDHVTNFSLTDGNIICNGLTKGANKYIVKGLLYLVIGEFSIKLRWYPPKTPKISRSFTARSPTFPRISRKKYRSPLWRPHSDTIINISPTN